jgi:uncharacterized delta-60 repeat protein
MQNVITSTRIAALALVVFLCSSTWMLAQAGSLDPTFGTGGIVTTPTLGAGCPTNASCSIAIQSDGKIVVAGATSSSGSGQPALARFNTNGTLDTTFGTGGLAVYNNSNGAFGLAIQSDGKIVTAGATELKLAVVRFNTDGTLDNTFGTAGVVETTAAGNVFAPVQGGLGVLPNGKIVVTTGSIIIRLLSDGAFDSSFGTDGVAELLSTAQSMALLPNGGVLVASQIIFSTGAATLYQSNGSLNSSFGVAGQVPDFGSMTALAPLSGGKIALGGTLANAAPTTSGAVATQGFVVTRYNSNGTIDTTFGSHGATVSAFPGEPYAAALGLAVQSNGDVVAAGTTGVSPAFGGTTSDFALARYTTTGQLDTTFGTNGLVTTAFGTGGSDKAQASAIAIQSDGKIVVVGYANSSTSGGNGFVLARYLAQ